MNGQKAKAFAIRFPEAPANGTVIVLRGDEFELTSSKPYIRRDGGETSLLSWSSWCKACGCQFDQSTGRSFTGLRKNCEPCRAERGRKKA